MGEYKRRPTRVLTKLNEEENQSHAVDTLGGRVYVHWDADAPATAHGQLVYFAEFLATTGVFDHWVSSCPLEYHSGNAPDKRDVLGILMLGLLAGRRRYAHTSMPPSSWAKLSAKGQLKGAGEKAWLTLLMKPISPCGVLASLAPRRSV